MREGGLVLVEVYFTVFMIKMGMVGSGNDRDVAKMHVRRNSTSKLPQALNQAREDRWRVLSTAAEALFASGDGHVVNYNIFIFTNICILFHLYL